MTCEMWSEKLDAYVDGELPSEITRALDDHLRQCAACSAATMAKMQLKQAVHSASYRFKPDSAFRARVQQQIASRNRTRRPWYWFPILATALSLVVAISLISVLQRQRGNDQYLLSELADLHVATLASANPVDVVSTDRHTVKPWFEGKIPFSFNVPELQGSDFTLVGGKVAYVQQSPGAELIVRVRKHQVSLFVFQERNLRQTVKSDSTLTGLNVRTWSNNGLRYFVIGDVTAEDLNRLTELVEQANR